MCFPPSTLSLLQLAGAVITRATRLEPVVVVPIKDRVSQGAVITRARSLAVITPALRARPALSPRRVIRPQDVIKKMSLHQMPAATKAERPDELPVKTIQTTINSKITPAASVRTRAPPHAVPCAHARAAPALPI